jgi:hypothetical protein
LRAQHGGEGAGVGAGAVERLRHLHGVAAGGLRHLLEDVGGEREELLRERVGAAGERAELLVESAALRAAGQGGRAERRIEQHPQRRRQRVVGPRVGGLGPRRR